MTKYRHYFNPALELDPQVPGLNLLDDLNATMAKLNIAKEQTFILNEIDHCEICNAPYRNKGPLKNYLFTKHGVLESSVFFGVRHVPKKSMTRKSSKGT